LFVLALVLFSLMGAVIKHVGERYSAAELSAYRNVFGLLPAIIALWSTQTWHQAGRPVRIRQWRMAMWRGAVVALAQLLFYLSLSRMAFATATTISYANALFMVAFAVPILAEKVGLVRWSAVLVGFAGVVLVMGVGRDAFVLDALLPLGAAACYALAGVTAPLIDKDVPTPLMNMYSASVSALSAGVFVMLWGGFSPIASSADMFWIVLMGAFGGCAVLVMVIAFRMTEQSNLAPFSYFGIPLAFVLGWAFFGETPWSDLFPGAMLIIAGGLLIVWRERSRKAARD